MPEKHTCDICGYTTDRKDNFTTHINAVHKGEKPFACDTCGQRYSRNYSLKRHKQTHNKPFPCHLCSQGYTQNEDLIKHLKAAHEGVSHTCSQCGKSFSQKSHLTQHMIIHSGKRPFACKICNQAFRQKSNLKTHIKKTHSGVNSEDAKTQQIDAASSSSSSSSSSSDKLPSSSRNSSTDIGTSDHEFDMDFGASPALGLPFSSPQPVFDFSSLPETNNTAEARQIDANSSSSSSASPRSQSRTTPETEEKPFKCPQCKYVADYPSQLTVHMRCHTGTKPYTCNTCGKDFAQKGNLTQHMRCHTRVKPYICNTCGEGFVRKHNLTKHIGRRHSNAHSSNAPLTQPAFNPSSWSALPPLDSSSPLTQPEAMPEGLPLSSEADEAMREGVQTPLFSPLYPFSLDVRDDDISALSLPEARQEGGGGFPWDNADWDDYREAQPPQEDDYRDDCVPKPTTR